MPSGSARVPPEAEAQIAETRRHLAQRRVHDPDFLAFIAYPFFRRVRVIADVGANRGQSIASFAAIMPRASIDAFEANPALFDVLARVIDESGRPVRLHRHGLGAADAVLPFLIPRVNGVAVLEEASTRADNFDKPWVRDRLAARGALTLEEHSVAVREGDGLGLSPEVIKVDVEGAEHDVLRGFATTIGSCRPVLMIENSEFLPVTQFLTERGYAPYRYDARLATLIRFAWNAASAHYVPDRPDVTAVNLFYLPEERRATILRGGWRGPAARARARRWARVRAPGR